MIKKVAVYIIWIIGFYRVFMNLELHTMGRRDSYSKLNLTQLANATTKNYDPEIIKHKNYATQMPLVYNKNLVNDNNIRNYINTLKEIEKLKNIKENMEEERLQYEEEKRIKKLTDEILQKSQTVETLDEKLKNFNQKEIQNKSKSQPLPNNQDLKYNQIQENNTLDELYEQLNKLQKFIKDPDIKNKDLLKEHINKVRSDIKKTEANIEESNDINNKAIPQQLAQQSPIKNFYEKILNQSQLYNKNLQKSGINSTKYNSAYGNRSTDADNESGDD